MITLTEPVEHDLPFIQFYQAHPDLSSMELAAKITTIAQFFLNRPYLFEPLGEGDQGIYSNLPLYRADYFDCVTYMNTVLALAHSTDFHQFKQAILQIRYANQQIDYTMRTDWFTDLEWNANLRRLGYLQDVTLSILDENKKPIAKETTAIINKPEFYAQKVITNLHLQNLSEDALKKRLSQLQAEGKKFSVKSSTLSYLPFTALFDTHGQPNQAIWAQFPPVSVIEIVRPNWRPVNPKDKQTDYGTNLNISHIGLAICTSQGIIFYHAATGNTVVKLLLTDYLHAFLNDERSAPVSGIHIEKII